jgi:hypothetical protein
MDESQFIEIDWLTAEEASDAIKDRRDKIAEQKGWDKAFWHSDQDTLKRLYALLGTKSNLMSDLEAASDESAQAAWLDAALEALTEAPPAQEAQPSATAPSRGGLGGEEGAGPEVSAAAETGEEAGVAGEETSETLAGEAGDDEAAGEEPATGDSSEEGPQQPSEAAAGGEEPAAEVTYPWSEDYGTESSGMFYRVNSETGEYEFAFSTTGDSTGKPIEPWAASAQEAVVKTAHMQLIEDAPIDVDPETAAMLANDESFAEELASAEAEAEDPELWDWEEMGELDLEEGAAGDTEPAEGAEEEAGAEV